MNPRFERGKLLLRLRRPQEAAREYLAVLAGEPENGLACAALGMAYAKMGQHELARASVDEALRLGGGGSWAYYVFGYVMFKQKQFAEAATWVQKAVVVEPENPHYLLLFAVTKMLSGREDEALRVVLECLRLTPQSAEAHNIHAALLWGKKEFAASEAAGRAALAVDPENHLAHVNFGYCHLGRGDIAQAIDSFEEALRLAPECEAAQRGLSESRTVRAFGYRLMLAAPVFFLAIAVLMDGPLGSSWPALLAGGTLVAILVVQGVWHLLKRRL